MEKFAEKIEGFIMKVGGLTSYLMLAILAFVTYEVISRYVFNAPTNWVWLISKQFFGVYVIMAGSFALVNKQHIRIEVFYDRFPPKMKTLIRWLSLLSAICFLGALIWKGGAMGLDAWQNKEMSIGTFVIPLYPMKMFIPCGAALFLLGCIVHFGKTKNE